MSDDAEGAICRLCLDDVPEYLAGRKLCQTHHLRWLASEPGRNYRRALKQWADGGDADDDSVAPDRALHLRWFVALSKHQGAKAESLRPAQLEEAA